MANHEHGDAPWQAFKQCESCGIRDLVLFADLTEADFSQIHLPIDNVVIPQGEALYQPGQPAHAVFTVREGLLKLEQYLPDGNRRIVSLLSQGDTAGLEATVADTYEHAAIALQTVKACRIPREVITRLSPRLHRQLMNKWHNAVRKSHDCLRELSTGSARQRVARLFLLLAPDDAEVCRLFGREDVGALLGITTETASRLVAELKRQSVVSEVSPNLFTRNLSALEAIAAE
ncbi:fumarate and nitrate reduction regulatory protein [mine drainage metagenome]|uniref:Fumarate and nitrate reduction regulatory protein n=1 Tax=mine drainage metagenome TaxID=410659 RepID=A0A1J5S397_9ZZZZ